VAAAATAPSPPPSGQLQYTSRNSWDHARIATALHLSEQTVRNYLSRLYARLGVRTRAEAIVWLRDHPRR
jgi:hypothetical protein